MSLKAFCSLAVGILLSAQMARADVNIRKVSYLNLPAMEVQPTLTPASDADCRGPDPFAAANWKDAGLPGGCSTTRIPYLQFNVGQKVPAFNNSVYWQPTDVAILTLDEINSMRALNPGATFRFEMKAAGMWSRGTKDAFMPLGFFPKAGCVTSPRFSEILRLYTERGLDWRNTWSFPRSKYAFGAPDYKAFQSLTDGLHGFNFYHYFDFDMDECDAPLMLKIDVDNYSYMKLNLLEVNIYVCTSKSACTQIPDLY